MVSLADENKKFGLQFGGLLLLLSFYLWFRDSNMLVFLLVSFLSILHLFLSFSKPEFLAVSRKTTILVGGFMEKTTVPIFMFFLYILTVLPTAFLSKVLNRDALRLQGEPQSSYWIERDSSIVSKDSFKNQF